MIIGVVTLANLGLDRSISITVVYYSGANRTIKRNLTTIRDGLNQA
jgi:hypothetical protein